MTKTFKDFGLVFVQDESCYTCFRGTCQNTVYKYSNNEEYTVQILAEPSNSYYAITATNLHDPSEEIFMNFFDEEQAVKYVCDNFNWFKCF
jgi:hypothetical protein